MRPFFVSALSALLLSHLATPSPASMIFTGSGNNPEVGANASGSATFTISGNSLIVVLQNTTSPRTAAQGNAMTGVTFDVDTTSPTLTLSGTALTAGSAIWTSETSSNTSDPLAGSWTSTLGATPLGEYGVATTGFAGRFNGGSITLGNSNPNYGIVAANTFNGTDVVFGGSQFPFIQDSLTFTFTIANGAGFTEEQIGNVNLLFGTDGTGIVPGTHNIPEPATLLLATSAVLLGACVRRRSKKT
jgi:hypothetical protein